jgi:hypothetical protein
VGKYRLSIRRCQAALLAAALAVILLGTLWFVTHREPCYEGRSLSSWLEEINRAHSVSNAVPALLAICAMGTNTLPFLGENVRFRNPSPFGARIFAFAQRFDFLARRFPPRSSLYGPTCLAFRALGTNAAPIVAQLGELLLQSEHTDSAKLALSAIGLSAAPAFERGCASTNMNVRIESALYLARVHGTKNFWTSWSRGRYGGPQFTLHTGPTHEDLKTLAAQLDHPNPAVRRASTEVLEKKAEAKFLLSQLKSTTAREDAKNALLADTNSVNVFERFRLIPDQ